MHRLPVLFKFDGRIITEAERTAGLRELLAAAPLTTEERTTFAELVRRMERARLYVTSE